MPADEQKNCQVRVRLLFCDDLDELQVRLLVERRVQFLVELGVLQDEQNDDL